MGAKKKKGGISKEEVDQFLKDNPDYAKEWYDKNGVVATTLSVQPQAPSTSGSANFPGAGPPTNSESLTVNMFKDYINGTRTRKISCRKLDVDTLKNLNEEELFMELIRDIANELDVNLLCHKILMNVGILTNSDRGSLFLSRGPSKQRYLAAKLFDVTAVSTIEDSLKAAERGFTVPFGKGIAGHVAQSKEVVNIKEAYEVSSQ